MDTLELIKYLREGNNCQCQEAADEIERLHETIRNHVSWFGICSDAGYDDNYCDSVDCTYCALARIADKR